MLPERSTALITTEKPFITSLHELRFDDTTGLRVPLKIIRDPDNLRYYYHPPETTTALSGRKGVLRHHVLVARTPDDVAVGTATIIDGIVSPDMDKFPPNCPTSITRIHELSWIAISPEFHSRGLGLQLMILAAGHAFTTPGHLEIPRELLNYAVTLGISGANDEKMLAIGKRIGAEIVNQPDGMRDVVYKVETNGDVTIHGSERLRIDITPFRTKLLDGEFDQVISPGLLNELKRNIPQTELTPDDIKAILINKYSQRITT